MSLKIIYFYQPTHCNMYSQTLTENTLLPRMSPEQEPFPHQNLNGPIVSYDTSKKPALVIRIDVLIVHTVSILLYHLSSSLVGNLQLEIGK